LTSKRSKREKAAPKGRKASALKAKRATPAQAPAGDEAGKGTTKSFPIVGLGSSAGGLEAVQELLQRLPANTGMAFVLVQHLDPKHKSLLPEILAKATSMPVTRAEDGTVVEVDHVYVMPPNTRLSISHGVLHLQSRVSIDGQHLPIDHFLRSLAEDQHEHAISVILSGNGSDGAEGTRAVKE
jgi:two-component system, chemotaxis family, CheB/CheR fusion protein